MIPLPVELVEVGPRDGLQNEARTLCLEDKIELIRRLVSAGVRRIEVASFVRPGLVPQMADAEAVCAALPEDLAARTIGLVLNKRGADRALTTNVDEISSVVSATDSFGRANQGRSRSESLEDAIEITRMCGRAGRHAHVTISVAFGCPFEGNVAPEQIVGIARRLADAGVNEIALADTIGVAAPTEVSDLIGNIRRYLPGLSLRGHFHDTRGMGAANAWAAFSEGLRSFDSSIAGLGGCPFAPNAGGNVATEDLLYLFSRCGVPTGIDLNRTIEVSRWVAGLFGREPGSRISKIGVPELAQGSLESS